MVLLQFKKLNRYYHLYKQDDLFGGITLICSWGTFDSKRGGHKFIFCKNQLELYAQLSKISKVRLMRNYRLY
jgi:hypothetical protein